MKSRDMAFAEWLDYLAGNVGARHGLRNYVVIAGLREGLTPEEVRERIHDNCGEPPLTWDEIDEAITYCVRNGGEGYEFNPEERREKDTLEQYIADATAEERATVADMIREGEAWDKAHPHCHSDVFGALSPLPPNPRKQRAYDNWLISYQSQAFVSALFPDDEVGRVFATDKKREKRDAKHIWKPSELWTALGGNIRPPQFICPNTFTGVPAKNAKGNESYGTKKSIYRRRFALLEFDDMRSWRDQAHFGISLILRHPKSVVSATLSRGKSIHFLVRMPEPEPDRDMFGKVIPASDSDKERMWQGAWAKLARRYSTSEEKDEKSGKYRLRCDRQCKDSVRMTRLPGAERLLDDGTGCGLRHVLLYLNPEATEAIV